MTPLTQLERETLELIAAGWTHERIARHRGITDKGSHAAANRIFHKLGAANAAHAVHLAHNAGILTPPEEHGTTAAHQRHRRRREPPCRACLDHMAAVRREQRAAAKNAP